jgi:hypothetical protein
MLAFKATTAICFLALLMPVRSLRAAGQIETNDSRNEFNEPVEGTWKLKVDRLTQGTTFNVFMSFSAGGVVVATGSLDKLESVSTVFGSWKRSGRNRVDVTIYFFLFDPAGNPIGTLKTNETFRLHGKNRLTGTGLSYTCDVGAETCGDTSVGQVALAGTRVEAEGVKEKQPEN